MEEMEKWIHFNSMPSSTLPRRHPRSLSSIQTSMISRKSALSWCLSFRWSWQMGIFPKQTSEKSWRGTLISGRWTSMSSRSQWGILDCRLDCKNYVSILSHTCLEAYIEWRHLWVAARRYGVVFQPQARCDRHWWTAQREPKGDIKQRCKYWSSYEFPDCVRQGASAECSPDFSGVFWEGRFCCPPGATLYKVQIIVFLLITLIAMV